MKGTSLVLLTIALLGMMPLFTRGVPYEGRSAYKYWKNNYKTDKSLLKRMNEKLAHESDTVVRAPACESQGPEVRQSTTAERFSTVACECTCQGTKAKCGVHKVGLKCEEATNNCDSIFWFARYCTCTATCEFA